MIKITNYIILLLGIVLANTALSDEYINCIYLTKLPDTASETERRSALSTCKDLIEQKTLLLSALKKQKEETALKNAVNKDTESNSA